MYKKFLNIGLFILLQASIGSALAATNVALQNGTGTNMMLTDVSSSSGAYCSENGTGASCYSVLNFDAQQWATLNSNSDWIVLSYNLCGSISNGECQEWVANTSVTMNMDAPPGYEGSFASFTINNKADGVSNSDFNIQKLDNSVWKLNYKGSTGGDGEGTPITVNFENSTPSVAHLDYASTEFTASPEVNSDGNLPYLSTTTFNATGENPLNLQIKQYGVENFVEETPTCYYSFALSGDSWQATENAENPAQDCAIVNDGDNAFTVTMTWPEAQDVDYTAVRKNSTNIVTGFINNKGSTTALAPNQLPLSEAQQENFVSAIQANAANGWTLQFGYDVIRLPLWLGAYYAQSPDKASPDVASYVNKTAQFIAENSCQDNSGNTSVNSAGFWAYSVPGVSTDGAAVEPASCENTPALQGPLAMAAVAAGNTDLANALINTLSQYDIAANTFSAYESENGTQASQSNYTSTSSPYFNASLDLISQALLIGNGNLNISSANNGSSSSYLTYENFLENYQAWLDSGFIAEFNAPDPANGEQTQPAARVIYSTYNALNYSADSPTGTLGNSPTVSEGMAYGMLIAYAANDQATFDKFLWFVLSESYYQGCAQLTEDKSACSVKSQYLMPWMVDESGKPFNYEVAGGYLTNGSAYDADIQIVWALGLANERVASGAWTAPNFNGKNYQQLAVAMIDEINRYETAHNVSYFGQELDGDGVMFTPGSQWGAPLTPEAAGCQSGSGSVCGTDLIYPGYITPQAFDMMEILQAN